MSKTLTQDQKVKIIAMNSLGMSQRSIAKEVIGRASAKSTIGDFLRSIKSEVCEQQQDNSRVLLISDMHLPYHHEDTFRFLQYLKNKYDPTRVISLGDECFPAEAEVMTEQGWVSFEKYVDEYNKGNVINVVQVDDKLEGLLVKPDRVVYKEAAEKLLRYEHKTMVSCTTPRHNLVKINPNNGELHRREAWDNTGTSAWEIPRNIKSYQGEGVNFTDDELRLIVAYQADGTLTKGAMRFSFTKKRKADRLEVLLNNLDIPFNQHKVARGDLQYYIEVADTPRYLEKIFRNLFKVTDLSNSQLEVFVSEVSQWDSYDKKDRFRYTSKFKDNVEFVQQAAVLSGKSARRVLSTKVGEHEYFYLDVINNPEKCSLKSAKQIYVDHNKPVYCVTVPTGMILTRQEGWISVSGNCDKHSLSYHENDPDLSSAGDELKEALKCVRKLHKMFPEMDILESNHGSLVWRKAKTHGIPRAYIKSYNEVLGVSDGWKWHYDMTIDLPNGTKCYLHHGKVADVTKLSQQMGMCAVQGHYHEKFKVEYWGNPTGLYWALQIGCLIDDNSLAFAYNNANLKRPVIGTGLIIDGLPVLEPMVLDKDGNWIGE